MPGSEVDLAKRWNQVYSEKHMTNWYPSYDILRFCSKFIQKRLTYDTYDVKKNVKNVLDLGSGNGRHVIFFANQGFEVSGIDISDDAIKLSKEWCAREGLDADCRVGDITDLPYKDASFDLVVSHGVLDHVHMSDACSAVNEVNRVLTPSGLFYCDLRGTEDFEFEIGEKISFNTFMIPEGFEKGLIQHFFSLKEVHELFDEHFKIIYIEKSEHVYGPDFTKRNSRWIVGAQKL